MGTEAEVEDEAGMTSVKMAFSGKFMVKERNAATEKDLYVSGFVSMNGSDRSGDFIDPQLFDIESYMANPQLWYNHELWRTKDGNRISIGAVEALTPVSVSKLDSAESLVLNDLRTGTELRTVPAERFLNRKGNERGLWVVCKVTVPDIIEMIEDGRINAFSWQGVLFRRKTGAISRIDLMEISLVNLPAHKQALFQIGKNFYIQETSGTEVHIDLDAIQALNPKGLVEMKREDLTEEERSLLDKKAPPQEALEGGDIMADKEMMEKLAAITEQLGSLAELPGHIEKLTERIDVAEKAREEEVPAPKPEEKPVVPDTEEKTAEKPPEETEASSDAETTAALAAITEKLNAFASIPDTLTKLATRLATIEGQELTQKSLTDADAATDVELAKLNREMRSATPERQQKVARRVLGSLMVPDRIAHRKHT